MAPTSKLSQAEELEKQYNEYRAQFENWKEKNRDSFGSEAYIKYVKQFEDWERDVERRRAQLKQAAVAEKEAIEKANIEAEQRRIEQEIQQRKNEEAAAQAYAEEQAAYLAMHQQAAMQDEQQHFMMKMQQSSAGIAPSVQQQPPHLQLIQSQQQQSPSVATPNVVQPSSTGEGVDQSMVNVMQQMLNFVMAPQAAAEKTAAAEPGRTMNETSVGVSFPLPPEIPPPSETATGAPQLWGADGAPYLPTDPMFRRWNVRAAPPNFRIPYQPPPSGAFTPGWLMLKKLSERRLTIFVPPQQPPLLQQQPPGVGHPLPIVSQLGGVLPPHLAGIGAPPFAASLMNVPPPTAATALFRGR